MSTLINEVNALIIKTEVLLNADIYNDELSEKLDALYDKLGYLQGKEFDEMTPHYSESCQALTEASTSAETAIDDMEKLPDVISKIASVLEKINKLV